MEEEESEFPMGGRRSSKRVSGKKMIEENPMDEEESAFPMENPMEEAESEFPVRARSSSKRAADKEMSEEDDDWDGAWEEEDLPMGPRAQARRSGTVSREEMEADDLEDEEELDEEDEEQYADTLRWQMKDRPLPGRVFQGMEDFPEGEDEDEESSGRATLEELSLLYDDFEVSPGSKKMTKTNMAADDEDGTTDRKATGSMEAKRKGRKDIQQKPRRKLNSIEEREYMVMAEGIAVRALPDERAPRTGEIIRQGERFIAVEAVDGEGNDPRLYLRLPDGRGWVFDDEKIYPGFPSVKLVAIAGLAVVEDTPKEDPRPLIAVIGRPNVGKSSLVNKICGLAETSGSITYDEGGTTRDRTYREAEHTDDCGDTFLFEVIDTGGMIFSDDLDITTFKVEIKTQIDVALREATACIFVVDSQVGLVKDDMDIAKYLKKTYMSRGLKVIVAVAKCDRLESMDLNCADFWSLDFGEPVPICSLHGRGIWEVVDKLINRGCNGLYPMKIKGQDAPPSRRQNCINVALVGKPNAGKSSLLNALVGETRCIVSDIPGTTTDAIDAYFEVEDGKVYRFIDTAGIRRCHKIKPGTEWLSVNRAIKAVKRCDVALLVLDASQVMTGQQSLGNAYWSPDDLQRYIARQIEEKGTAAIILLAKWDAVQNKDEKTQKKFVQAIRSNLGGVGQWAEVVTCSALTGQRLSKILEAIDKTLEAHRKRVTTPILNEVVRDALLWRLPAAMASGRRQGRIYYATQVSTEPPTIALFCNNPDLFGANYKTYLENKLRQDLGWFGTPMQLEWRKRSERRAISQAEAWLGPRLQPEETWR